MGDISELRGLLFVVSFLGVLALLISWVPAELYTAGDMRLVATPSELFETIDIYSFAESKIIHLNESGGSEYWLDTTLYREDIDIGEWDIDIYYRDANESNLIVRLLHFHYEWFIFPAHHYLEWFGHTGVLESDGSAYQSLLVSAIESNSVENGTSKFRASCDHTTYHVTFSYNSTLYGNFTHAWNQHGLYAFFGVNFDDLNTSYSAFQLLALLMFFQLPETNIYVNTLISIPIWVAVAYLMYVLIIKIIPFIAGG